jgi:glycosyltransferase involved in cell wall biosynthesis
MSPVWLLNGKRWAMAEAAVLHVLKRLRCGGGMGRIAALHAAAGEPVCEVAGSINGRPDSVAKRLRSRLVELPSPAVALLYNGYGAQLGIAEGADRVIAYLHSDFPGLEWWTRSLMGRVDGILTVNDELQRRCAAICGASMAVGSVAYPLLGVALEPLRQPCSPLRIGYVGRISRQQKRVERISGLLEGLQTLQGGYVFTFIGDGPDRAWLERQCSGDRRVLFSGHLTGQSYVDALAALDCVVFTSDYEGLPLALVEAVAAGAVPVYPAGCCGAEWVARLGAGLVYERQDGAGLAKAVRTVGKWGAEQRQAYDLARHRQLAEHTEATYHAGIKAFVDAVRRQPRCPRHRRRTLLMHLPLWVYHRLVGYRLTGERAAVWGVLG